MNLDEVLVADRDAWLSALPQYQRASVESLLSASGNPLDAASKWLTASPSDTAPFGGTKAARPLIDKIVGEMRGLLCGDPKYDSDRKQIAEKLAPTQAFLVGVVATAIGPHVGVSAAVVAPVVVLVFLSFGKCTLNAVCSVWEEQSKKESPPSES